MEPIQATFEVAKVQNNIWDVLIFADDSVLKAFVKVYPELTYVEHSVFDKKPMVIAADFPNQIHAFSWKEYWIKAFADPDNACKTCHTVNYLFQHIEKARNESRTRQAPI